MKFQTILALFVLLSGCSHQNSRPVQTVASADKKLPAKKSMNVAREQSHGVVWEVLSENEIILQFRNVDTKSNLNVVVQKGVSVHSIRPGHWELTGFSEKGKSFTSMNVSKKFVMKVSPKSLVYGGSLLTGCPAIENKDFRLLKNMQFFNRYPFSGGTGLCEMVIGNNLAGVRSQLKNSRKTKTLNPVMGF